MHRLVQIGKKRGPGIVQTAPGRAFGRVVFRPEISKHGHRRRQPFLYSRQCQSIRRLLFSRSEKIINFLHGITGISRKNIRSKLYRTIRPMNGVPIRSFSIDLHTSLSSKSGVDYRGTLSVRRAVYMYRIFRRLKKFQHKPCQHKLGWAV